MKVINPYIIATMLLVATSSLLQAQCKNFTKKSCLPELTEYTGNGQYNGAVMFEGEEADLLQTFYAGKDYRIMVCSQASIQDSLYFEISDYAQNLIFSSKENRDDHFDFTVESTQMLNIKVAVPEMGTANELKKNGCVSIIVGFKGN